MVEVAMVVKKRMVAGWFFMFLDETIPLPAKPSALRKDNFIVSPLRAPALLVNPRPSAQATSAHRQQCAMRSRGCEGVSR
jgi:hypothetical protein